MAMDSSYVYSCNEGNVSCNHLYFTFYSEFRDSDIPGIVECVILFLIFWTSFLSNLLILYHGLTKAPLRSITNGFILNLVVADVVFTLTIPFIAIIRATKKWIFGLFLCRAVTCMNLMCATILIWSLTIIAIDRYRCIVIAPRKSCCKKYHILIVIAVVWIVPFCIYVPFAMQFSVLYGSLTPNSTLIEDYEVCTLAFKRHESEVEVPRAYAITITIINVVFPISIMGFTYFKIFQKLKASAFNRGRQYVPAEEQKKMTSPAFQSVDNICNLSSQSDSQSTQTQVGGFGKQLQESCSASHLPSMTSTPHMRNTEDQAKSIRKHRDTYNINFLQRMRRMRHYRVMKLLAITVIVEYAMWIPLKCVVVMIAFNSGHNTNTTIASRDFIYCLTVAFANPFANAILFGILNGNFKKYICWEKKEVSGSDPQR